jgi:hypothetical protein
MLPDLTKDPDGGLTLSIQNTSPGPGREANWLPTPTGGVPNVPAPVLAKRSSPQRSMDGTQARKNLKQASPPSARSRRLIARRPTHTLRWGRRTTAQNVQKVECNVEASLMWAA